MPPSMTVETGAVDRIDLDGTTYRISTNDDIRDLERSIRTAGLLNPPIVVASGRRLEVISGFRRIRACRALRMAQVPIRRLPEDTTARDRAAVAIADNLHQRPLNLIEQSRVYALLYATEPSADAAADAAKQLGLPANADWMDRVRRLCRMSMAIQSGILDGWLTLPMAMELDRLPAPAPAMLADLFAALKPGLNQQRELVTAIHEIARREGKTVVDILRRPEFRSALDGTAADRQQRLRRLRGDLHRQRYPNVSAAETAFRRTVKQLRLGEGIKLVPPRYFEGTTYRVELRFDTVDDLQELSERLRRIVGDPLLARLLMRENGE